MMFRRDNIIRYTLLLVALMMPLFVEAQEDSLRFRRESQTHKIGVDFGFSNSVIERDLKDNAEALDRIDSLLNTIKEDSTILVESFEFFGSSSPEGRISVNKQLSKKRMKAVESYVREHISLPDSVIIHSDKYIDWEYLIKLVERDETLPMREEVLNILRSDYPTAKLNGIPIEGRTAELMKLNSGKVWSELTKRYFVVMRKGAVSMTTYREVPVEPELSEEEKEALRRAMEIEERTEVIPEDYTDSAIDDSYGLEEMGAFDSDFEAKYQKTPLISVKTNLLAYSTLIPNAGVEFRIGKRLSAEVTAMYSPFNLFVHDFKTRLLAMKPEIRYWWGESLRQGHFVGIHMPLAGFNIQLNDKYRYQDSEEALWGIGLNYGYAMLIGKRQNWSLDFTIGFGYMNVNYDIFEGRYNGKYLRSEGKHYFGPTRIGINLSYIINRKSGK